MYNKSAEKILEILSPKDTVLDIGGWAQPFNRANYVIDIMPYESRGFFGSIGPVNEHFSKGTWITHDISSHKPLPFGDKEIDFVICSHTLEDIRDPLRLCSEIIRIGKRGYIEVPSRIVESTAGLEDEHYTGCYHHRWLIEIEGSEITFRFKPHLMNKSWKYHFPKAHLKNLPEEKKAAFLFWENSFQYQELIQISLANVMQELEEFVKKEKAYPALFYLWDRIKHPDPAIESLLERSPRLRGLAKKIIGRETVATEQELFWSKIPEIRSD
jgi:ubiquinone/menaquinone biosynthesis C-methylase UbiE